MFPYSIICFQEIIVKFYSVGNQRAVVRKLSALIYHEKVSVLIQVRGEGENTALHRAHFSMAERRISAFQEIDLAVPAFGEFVVFGIFPAPVKPVFISCEELFLSGKKIYSQGKIIVFILCI